MPEFVARNVTILDFSNPRHIQLPEVYHPPSCIIKFEKTSVDIGSSCYAVRKLDKKGRSQTSTINSQGIGVQEVLLDSLDMGCIPLIRMLSDTPALALYAPSFCTSGNLVCNAIRL